MIKVLAEHIANKIAAGEVITSPLAVMKELVENAVDAGATQITCEIRKGGKEYIRVTDNGSGIPSEETELAFEKHATGKIVSEEDLDHIGTLGFRGEALGSIATVSNVELVTRTAEETVGTRLLLHYGEVEEKKGIGCEVGTTVIVEDLFANTPARLKFLKSERGEGARVHDFIGKAAIAYPEIAFKFISNGTIIFHTRGKGDGLAAILTVYGSNLKGKLIPVEKENASGTMSLRAFIADPMENRPSKRNQIYFVNGRLVQDKVLEQGVAAAYKNRMFAGRYPVVYLFLDISPSMLDVNIHPSKDEVRFYEPETIERFVEEALTEALASKELIPETKIRRTPAAGAAPERAAAYPVSKGEQLSLGDAPAVREEPDTKEAPLPGEVSEILKEIRREETDKAKRPERMIAEMTPSKPFDFKALEYLGIVFATYILACDEDSFYFIDQHAAHERIRFERIMAQFLSQSGESQMLLVPQTVDGPTEGPWVDTLTELGFELEPFGPTTWMIRAIPMSFTDVDIPAFLQDLWDAPKTVELVGEELYLRIATMACKGAVKAHDTLRESEAEQLLRDLADCEQPFSCPHGRPTFLRLRQTDIERDFKRK